MINSKNRHTKYSLPQFADVIDVYTKVMEHKEGTEGHASTTQGQDGKGTADLSQKYKDYENNKELVKDDNPYR